MEHLLTVAIPVVFAFLMIKILLKPISLVAKLLLNTGLGFASLFLLNLLGPYTGVVFELNFLTAALTGVLGVPGVILLLVLQFAI